MRKLLGVLLICISISAASQTADLLNGPGGQFSLGVRTTASFFNDQSGTGTGYGGQFRLRFFRLLSSDWFADYIQSDIQGLGKRTDYHIGWAVIFYPPFAYYNNRLHKIQPYFLAGHCFDYTKFTSNWSAFYTPAFVDPETQIAEDHRWSAAVSLGLGFHLPMTEKIDISMNALFMNHLGNQIVATKEHDPGSGQDYLMFSKESPNGLDGHLLVSFSLNYRLADLWKKTIKTRHQSDQMQDQNKPNQF